MAKLSADTLALDGVRPSSSAIRLASSPPLGYFQGYHHGSVGASATICIIQAVGSSSFGSYALRPSHHTPQSSFSSGENFSICKTFLGSKCRLKRAEQGSCTTPEFSSSSLVCRMQDSQGSEWEREEARWLREEKRWVREEERWLHQEARWAAERKDLLNQNTTYKEQIKALKLEIVQLESLVEEEKSKDGTLSDLVVSLTRLLQSLNTATPLGSEGGQGSSFQAQISSSSSSSTGIRTALGSIPLEIPIKTIEMVTAVNQPSILESKAVPAAPSPSYERSRRTLKRGAEGDDVKDLQEALAKLGFYSGDDDMEYSTFSSGTERAVRSWQGTLGASEDGIVTAELLKKLLIEETPVPTQKGPSTSSSSPQGKVAPSAKTSSPASTSGAKTPDGKVSVKAKTSVSPAPERVTGKAESSSPKKPVSTDVETSPKARVYLLGENRWEEPDRLLSKNGPTTASAVATATAERCFSCKGQGTMMCTECEGTGEMNVEEQFLEWADEGANCPYCEGKGVLDCDVCDGKGVKARA